MTKPTMAKNGGGAGGGEDLVAALRKKTGQDRENRPGWSFTLDGAALGPHLRPDEPDPFTPEQRENGVELDFVFLTLRETQEAEGRAGARLDAHGGSIFSLPTAIPEECTRAALWRVDGRPVGDEVDRDRLWEALGKSGRVVCMGQYTRANASEEGSLGRAVKKAADSFRVRA
ncbi:MAG TPA: hypothetical protein VFS43_38395 [Polyangiaceae bacterium]|nr:hypothetical protein [Polyangiaceae bacterium]